MYVDLADIFVDDIGGRIQSSHPVLILSCLVGLEKALVLICNICNVKFLPLYMWILQTFLLMISVVVFRAVILC